MAHDHRGDDDALLEDCGNCARPDRDVTEVRRVYLVLDDAERTESVTVLDEVERWCFSCRSQYPNEPVG